MPNTKEHFQNGQSSLMVCQSGEISPNLVTLVRGYLVGWRSDAFAEYDLSQILGWGSFRFFKGLAEIEAESLKGEIYYLNASSLL